MNVKTKEILLVAVLLASALALAFPGVVFRGESLVVSDNLNPLDPTRTKYLYGPASDDPERWDSRNLVYTPNLNDPWSAVGDWEPNGQFLRRALAAGSWPLWNPYLAAGVPDLADPNPAYFFPPHLLLVLLGNSSLLKSVYALLLALQAGLFTYLFLRIHEVSIEASFFGAIVYMLGGGVTQHLGLQLLDQISCLPLVLYTTALFLDRPGRVRAAALAVVYAVVALAGFAPMLVAIFLLAAAYALWMIVGRSQTVAPGGKIQLLGRYFGVTALALGLVAFSFLPAVALNLDAPSQVERFYTTIDHVTLPATGLYSLLSPTLLHGGKVLRDPPMRGLPEWYDVLAAPSWIMMPAVGVVPLMLAALARPRRRTTTWSLALFSTIGLVLLTVKLLKLGPLEFTQWIPGLDRIHYTPYFGFLYNGLFAVLAAIGLDSLSQQRVTRRQASLALIAAAAVLASLRTLAYRLGALEHPEADRWLGDWWQAALLSAAVVSVAFALTVVGRARIRRLLILSLVAGAAFELAGTIAVPRNQRADVWRRPPAYVRALEAEAGRERVFAEQGLLHANASAAFGIFGLDSLNTYNSERVFKLYRHYTGSNQRILMMQPAQLPPDGVLDRAAVGHIAVKAGDSSMVDAVFERGYREWYRDDVARLFARDGSPRYFFSSSYRTLEASAALEAIAAPSHNRELILEHEPSFPSLPNTTADPMVDVTSFGVNGFVLSLDAPRTGAIYLAEADFAGWRASVNGEPAAIVPANFAFRAVEVPAGPVVLEMSYWPPGLTTGLWISAISLLALLALTAPRPRGERASATGDAR